MLVVREGMVTHRGNPVTLVGQSEVKVGDKVPNFRLAKSVTEDLEFHQLLGRQVILNVIPSIDTPTSQTQTHRFSQELSELGEDVLLVTISMDLPFALQRWCDARGIANVEPTSDYKYQDFGKKFALLVRGMGWLARSVFVIDRGGILRYVEIVPEVEEEPNYTAALGAVIHNRINGW